MKTEKAITKISMITVLAWAITAVLCAGAIAPAIGAPSLPLTTQEKRRADLYAGRGENGPRRVP